MTLRDKLAERLVDVLIGFDPTEFLVPSEALANDILDDLLGREFTIVRLTEEGVDGTDY